MNNNIVKFEDIDKYKEYLGSKTLRLKECIDLGLDVPKFVALPSFISKRLLEDESFRGEVSEEVAKLLNFEKYAVRSSALIEDGERESMAGQFLTKTNLNKDQLGEGIYEVLKQANLFFCGRMDRFSLIVQEYIASDISGVAFTRNPNGGRETILEYGFCEGEKVVSGRIVPSRVSFFRGEHTLVNLPRQFLENHIIEKFEEVENFYKFPQDIEWCIKDGSFYILQTRPITTISKRQYEQIIFLEDNLPKNEKYFFEKTEITEIAPRPSNFTFDLLRLIYSNDGPIKKVYRKFGVVYQDTNFLKIFGSELYVDREKEIQGLLPAYSYFGRKNLKPRVASISGLLKTVRNLFFLGKIATNGHDELFKRLKGRIEEEDGADFQDFEGGLKKFLLDYELIFEVNLLSGLSIKKLEAFLKNEPVGFSKMISSYSYFIDLGKYQVRAPRNLKGNFLDIDDDSVFVAFQDCKDAKNAKVGTWWGKLPGFKKKILRNKISEAILYNRMREFGRWLTVKDINFLRKLLFDLAEKNNFKNVRDIFFLDIDDILAGDIQEHKAIKNRKLYERYKEDFCLPNVITSFLTDKKTVSLGVSCGVAQGVLKNLEMLERESCVGEKIILYTEILSPDLVKYFDRVSGIVSNKGGMLSHLAIIARERKVPVIIGFSPGEGGLVLGDEVQIDGEDGTIVRIRD